jgi:hypothetical protein
MSKLDLVNNLLEKSFEKGFFANYPTIINLLCANQIKGNEIYNWITKKDAYLLRLNLTLFTGGSI